MAVSEKTYKKFLTINEDWRNKADGASTEVLTELLVEVAQNEETNLDAKENDQDLAEKKLQYDDAKTGYTEATKMNRLKIKYILNKLSP